MRERSGDIDVFLKEDLHDAVAGQRRRLEVLDVADLRRERALVIIDDAAGHVVGRQPVVSPYDGDDRNVDIGENVGRRRQRRAHAEDGDDDGEHDERVRTPEGGEDDPHVDGLLRIVVRDVARGALRLACCTVTLQRR